jgi:uncharacterized repeat protein (TIGR02543 family)
MGRSPGEARPTMSARNSRFGTFGSSSGRGKVAGAVIACTVMLLAGCGGSAADVGAPVIRGDLGTGALIVSNTTTTGTVGTPITLTSTGGTGTDTVTFTSSADCTVSEKTSLAPTATATAPVACTVAATQGAQTSEAVTFTFTAAAAATPLTVSGTPKTAVAGTPISLTSTGGSGTVTYASSTGCTVTGTSLTATAAATCNVTAIQGGQTSAAVTFTFTAAGAPSTCWRAVLSPFGNGWASAASPEAMTVESDVLGGQPTDCFYGATWVPGGFLDGGYLYKSTNRTTEFAGWNTAEDGTGVAYTPGVTATIPAPFVSNRKFYAQYRSCCTVSFDAAGGSGSMSQMTGSVGSSAQIPKVAFTRPGFAATDWTETRASYSMYCVYGIICPRYGDSGAWVAGDRLVLDRSYVLQPEWQPAWTVTFDGNGGPLGAAAQMPSEVFWDKEPRLLDLNRFARSGYKFLGWNTRSDGTGTAYSQRQVMTPPADITLYAQWSCSACYTVSFDANGGNGTMSAQVASAPSALMPNTNAIKRTGYAFDGWATTPTGSKAYADGASYPFTSSATLYARWVEQTFTVTFDANGGSGSTPSQSASKATALTANAYKRFGYAFGGWATTATGSIAYADGASYPFTETATLYATWGCLPLTVTVSAQRVSAARAEVRFTASQSESPWKSFAANAALGGGKGATVNTSSNTGTITVNGLNSKGGYTFNVTATNAAGCAYTVQANRVSNWN